MGMPDVGKPFQPRVVSWLRFLCILMVVVLLHLVIGYVLVVHAPRKVLSPASKPVEAVLIQPPPTQLPPPLRKAQPLAHAPSPGTQSSPPPVVAQPDAAPQVSHPAPVIQAAAAPPAAAMTAPTMPPSHAPVVTGPQEASIGLVCPAQVAPETPRRALKEGIEGVVRAQIRVKGDRVVDVTILSGPRIFHAAVREAMLQYRCMTDGGEVIATQDFNFKLE